MTRQKKKKNQKARMQQNAINTTESTEVEKPNQDQKNATMIKTASTGPALHTLNLYIVKARLP